MACPWANKKFVRHGHGSLEIAPYAGGLNSLLGLIERGFWTWVCIHIARWWGAFYVYSWFSSMLNYCKYFKFYACIRGLVFKLIYGVFFLSNFQRWGMEVHVLMDDLCLTKVVCLNVDWLARYLNGRSMSTRLFKQRQIYHHGRAFVNFSGHGGFSDLRDHNHCLAVAAMYQVWLRSCCLQSKHNIYFYYILECDG